MPAPATRLLLPLALLLVPACASNPAEPGVAATPSGAVAKEANFDRYTPPPPVSAAPVEALADLKTNLAAYEAELAQYEARLRSMGVRIARAERSDGDTKADDKDADRFAQPPPARPGDAPVAGASTRTNTSPSPTPRPNTTTPKPEASPGKSKSASVSGEAEAQSPPRPPRDARKSATRSASAADEARQKDGEGGRCTDLCDLAHATCDLEAKICDLATRHVDEPRYAAVCQRAGDDCSAAADACNLCSP